MSQRGHVFEFLLYLTGPGCHSNEPFLWLKLFLETRRSATSIELLIDLLACLELKLWPQNPILIYENCRKCIESPTGVNSICDNSMLEHASELFEASNDSWSLLVCTAKKTWYLGSGFSVGGVRKRAFFKNVLLWCHHPDNGPNLWFKIWLHSRLEYESLEPLMDFLRYLVPKLGPKDAELLGSCLSNFRGFPQFISRSLAITFESEMLQSPSNLVKTRTVA